eukprot:346048-Hanusia_phi.AAC.1
MGGPQAAPGTSAGPRVRVPFRNNPASRRSLRQVPTERYPADGGHGSHRTVAPSPYRSVTSISDRLSAAIGTSSS